MKVINAAGIIIDWLWKHRITHENAGVDEISVTALSGLLADDQHVLDSEVLAVAVSKTLMTTRGDIIYRNATVPARLAKGTDGQYLKIGADDPEWADVAVSVGGLYGINVEALSATKTLTAGTDVIYQYLDPNGANRIVNLDTGSATAGDRFIIRNNGAFDGTYWLAAMGIDVIYAGSIREYIFDGTSWISRGVGSGETDNKKYNLSIGMGAKVYGRGVAVGYIADAHSFGVAVGYGSIGYTRGAALGHTAYAYSYGVAVGYSTEGQNYGVGIGYGAHGNNYGIAIGQQTDSNEKRYSIAILAYAKCYRHGETSINIDGNNLFKNNVVQGRWSLTTTNNTPAEMFSAAYSTATFTIRPSSHLAFKMTVVARDNVANEGAMYTFEGVIKRDASNNTTMSIINKAIIYEDDATWDVAVTANDTNESLKIEVTGDASNPVQWAVRMDGVETHF